MIDPALRRQFFAEEIEAVAHLRTRALCEALAAVPREAFLQPGPWLVRGEDEMGGAHPTPDADPRHVYHNCSIAIDASRQLCDPHEPSPSCWIHGPTSCFALE